MLALWETREVTNGSTKPTVLNKQPKERHNYDEKVEFIPAVLKIIAAQDVELGWNAQCMQFSEEHSTLRKASIANIVVKIRSKISNVLVIASGLQHRGNQHHSRSIWAYTHSKRMADTCP